MVSQKLLGGETSQCSLDKSVKPFDMISLRLVAVYSTKPLDLYYCLVYILNLSHFYYTKPVKHRLISIGKTL